MDNIAIETSKQEYLPGESLNARVKFNFKKPVKSRGVHAILHYHEKKKKMTYSSIPPDEIRRMKELGLEVTTTVKMVETMEEKSVIVADKKLYSGEISDQLLTFSLNIPERSPATSYVWGHDGRIVVWYLKIKVDISMSPDINDEKEIIIGGLV
jgi:hypothetical protein